jgi:hypothetical protein
MIGGHPIRQSRWTSYGLSVGRVQDTTDQGSGRTGAREAVGGTVSPLFRKSEEQVAQQTAAEAEVERLGGLPIDDLALEILPAFGPDGLQPGRAGARVQDVCKWLMSSYPSKFCNPLQIMTPVNEGIQRLENAGLVLRRVQEGGGSRITATRLGETALAEGTAKQHLTGPAAE